MAQIQTTEKTLSGLRLHQFPSAWNDDANLSAINRPGNSPVGRNWISVITNEADENVCETHGATAEEAVEIAETFLRAVNSHDALVEALQLLQGFDWRLDDSAHAREIKRRAIAALAAAQE